MKAYFKSLSLGAYLSAIGFLVLLISFILAVVSNAVVGYAISSFGLLILFSLVGLVGVALSLFLAGKKDNSILAYLGDFVAMILALIGFAIVIASRTNLIGTLWITALDSVNPLAVRAMNTGAAAFIGYFLSAIILLVASFFDLKKESQPAPVGI